MLGSQGASRCEVWVYLVGNDHETMIPNEKIRVFFNSLLIAAG